MNFFKNCILFLILIFLISCSKDLKKNSILTENTLEKQVIEAYEEGLKSLKEGDVLFAAKKFNEVEILYPQSDLAPKSALMAAYSYYTQDYYEDAIAELLRFIRVYPVYINIDYAYYLLGLCYYEQIVDEKKDLQSIIEAKNTFQYLISNYSNTNYAKDANYKLDLINDTLASKEMYIGRYYVEKKKWIAAINRFKNVLNDFQTTIYIEEALYRLVEIHYLLGLKDEAQKYANLLGYNYQSSEWYSRSYSFFDKNYELQKKQVTKSNKILKNFKSLFKLDE